MTTVTFDRFVRQHARLTGGVCLAVRLQTPDYDEELDFDHDGVVTVEQAKEIRQALLTILKKGV